MKHYALSILIGMTFTSCSTEEQLAETKTIRTPGVSRTLSRVVPFKLGFADSKGIDYTAYKDIVNRQADDRKNNTLRIQFGKLSLNQYNQLMQRYGGQNFVTYDASKDYRLLDFLPPKIQALSGKNLVPTHTPVYSTPKSLRNPYEFYKAPTSTVMMNCWTTSYEVLRDWGQNYQSQTVNLGYFSGITALKVFNDTKYLVGGIKILSWTEMGSDKVGRNRGRKPGDLLVVTNINSTEISPAHTAIWLDNDLYFEKINSGSKDHFRLATWTDAITPYIVNNSIIPPKVSFRRFKSLPSVGSFPKARGSFIDNPGLRVFSSAGRTHYVSQDVGLGGNTKQYEVSEILRFRLGRGSSGRAILSGASNESNFQLGTDRCWSESFLFDSVSDRPSLDEYKYKLTFEGGLKVFNKKNKQIASLSSRKVGNNIEANLSRGRQIIIKPISAGFYEVSHDLQSGGQFTGVMKCFKD